ncbi:hypothetical protein CCZ01_03465 [Helicobacter monodelphidis]|uniref:rhodanese-like domain-containing protein n=1 Tax=Helicobacter sp. 15-1451 TaxID=2004995 RepID=UPI000DCF40BB|nr:rhodanese-like domain-containing protein [Helicobacter sp. 15-1451]RAX58144.1 hypothetical protein CCZ01_03465 [Helicobacter sp. 15-1451]
MPPQTKILDLKTFDKENTIFIDVRTRGYYLISHVENAIHIESAERIGFIAEENRDKQIALYCHSGSVAMSLAAKLEQEGHDNVVAINKNFFYLPKYGIPIVGEGATKI